MTKYLLAALAVLAVAAGMLAMHFRASAAVSGARAAVAEQRAAQLDAALKASESARAQEHAQAKQFQDIAQQYEQDKTDAQAKADRTIADLRAGTVRLRSQWQGCQARGVSAAPASASQPDADAQLRSKGASDLVRIAAEADAQIRGLQAALKAQGH